MPTPPSVIATDALIEFDDAVEHYADNPLNEQLLHGRCYLNGYLRTDCFDRWDMYSDLIKERYLIDVDVSKEMYYRPEEVSYVLYGTYELGNFLCYINSISSGYSFNKPTIKAIDPTLLSGLISILSEVHERTETEIVNGDKKFTDITVKSIY